MHSKVGRKLVLWSTILIALGLLGAACSSSVEPDAVAVEPQTIPSPEPTVEVAPEPTATPVPPAPTATPDASAELSSVAVYESIRDSVVFVERPDGSASGSGIVIEGGWILTNAHVVERFGEVRIGRSDGVSLGEHPVHSVDWVFDLALVGPVDDESLVAMTRGESSELGLGGRVLLVGFPDEDSSTPTPTLTEGIVSRRRAFALGDYSFLQVDATIAPGQSGGALVNGWGELVGISGLEFGAGEFGLVFESDAMWPRLERLLEGPTNMLPTSEPVFELAEEIGPRRNFSFIVEVEPGLGIDLFAFAEVDIYVDIQTLGGTSVRQLNPPVDPFLNNPTESRLRFDNLIIGGEDVLASVDPGFYQVVVGPLVAQTAELTVTSTNPLRPFVDVEEGSVLPTGEIVEGQLDWTYDSDRWLLDVEAGQEVSITVDGIGDALFVVRLDDVVVTVGDDEGLGIYGEGAHASFVAEEAGTYEVEVGTFNPTRWGYLIEALVE